MLTPLAQKQIDDRAQKDRITVEKAKTDLLSEKQPSLQFTRPEQRGELAVFLCSAAADNIRGVARAVDAGLDGAVGKGRSGYKQAPRVTPPRRSHASARRPSAHKAVVAGSGTTETWLKGPLTVMMPPA